MLKEHREPNPEPLPRRTGRPRRNVDDPLVVGAYTVEQIRAFNLEHDRKYGFRPDFPHYTRAARLPETYSGPVEKVWDRV